MGPAPRFTARQPFQGEAVARFTPVCWRLTFGLLKQSPVYAGTGYSFKHNKQQRAVGGVRVNPARFKEVMEA